jgi:mono/diheme cytochrome c family protein
MKRGLLISLLTGVLAGAAFAQPAIVKQGEQVFATTCATGYCHGARGGAGGAPRLAARGFDAAYIRSVVTNGIPDTGMGSFTAKLSRPDLIAVIAYVSSLNGVEMPDSGGAPGPGAPALSGEAATGARLFKEATRSFGRCSTCHEVGGFGVPVAGPIAHVPDSVAALRSLATPNVKTASMAGESMPALVLSDGKRGTLFYDLTSAPPVERSAETGAVKFSDGSGWRHASAIGAYKDDELTAILAYLRAVTP